MEILFLVALPLAFHLFKAAEQRQRIALLARHLGQFEIEKLMETLIQGYLRALGEPHAERQRQVWEHFALQEGKLRQQFMAFAEAFSEVWADDALVSRLPLAFPRATKLFPQASFDLRTAFRIHAEGLDAAVRNAQQLGHRDRAYTITAELLLMQHTCHWFCRSKSVASARLLQLHKTGYDQVLQSVSAQTRKSYLQLIAA